MSYLHKFGSSVAEASQHCCPLSKSCPHLDGEPAGKVLAERNYLRKRVDEMEEVFNLAQDEIGNLRKRISQLEKENLSLKEDLTQAKLAPFKKASKKRNPDETAPKRGPAFGHPGTSRRKPENIDEIIGVPLQKCPECGNEDLSFCKHWDEHLQEDIVIKKVITRCFVHFHYWCPACKRIVSGYAHNEIPKAPIGPMAKAAASYLRYRIKISYDDIQRILEDFFGLKVSPGSIVGFDNKISQKALPLYNGLKGLLPHTSSIHADETGWKIDGEGSWLWTFTNKQLAFYHIDRHRSGDVVKEHLGFEYSGILNSDFYSAYNKSIKAFAKQKCTTHLLRDIKEMEEKFPDEEAAISFCESLKTLIHDALLLHSQYENLKNSPDAWKSRKRKLFARLKALSKSPVEHPKAETLRKRLLRHRDEILTFLNHPEIDPDNNRAERALRNLVIFRKITFGNRSEQGAKNLSVAATVIETARLKGLDPKNVFQTLLTKGLTPEMSEQFGLPVARPP